MADESIRFLVLQGRSANELLWITPIIRCLKQQVEQAEVHVLTRPEWMWLLEGNAYVSKLWSVANGFEELVAALRAEHIHHFIDLQVDGFSVKLSRKLHVYTFAAKRYSWGRWLYVNLGKDRLPDKLWWHVDFETVKLFDVVDDGHGLDVPLTKAQSPDVPSGFVLISLWADYATQRLTPQVLKRVCLTVNAPIVFIGPEECQVWVDELVRQSDGSSKMLTFCGKLDEGEELVLFSEAKAVLAGRSLGASLAATLGKRCAVVLGNLDKRVARCLPQGVGVKFFEVAGLKCRPCTTKGFRMCPKKHLDCMQQLDAMEIARFLEGE